MAERSLRITRSTGSRHSLTVGVRVFGHAHIPGGVPVRRCGAVGKPKDGDPRASFAVGEEASDGDVVSIERAECDSLAVAREMRAVSIPDESTDKLVAAA